MMMVQIPGAQTADAQAQSRGVGEHAKAAVPRAGGAKVHAAAISASTATSPAAGGNTLERAFLHPPAEARPWVYWYWLHAAVSKAGIAADLKAMQDVGIGGAYLMPIEDTSAAVPFQPAVRQLSPAFWNMARFAMEEAARDGIQLAIHDCDGFAVAGGPWITPAMSMQKVTWSQTDVTGRRLFNAMLPRPAANEGYYRDIRVYAYPAQPGAGVSSRDAHPVVTTDKPGGGAAFLALANNQESFTSDQPCWIQYAFDRPFTCRSIVITSGGNNYQAERLLLQVSDDGVHFTDVERMDPPRSGWQDADAPVTSAVPPTTARFFRFVYDKKGSEPGAEDLDAAKWKQTLKIRGIELLEAPRIHQYEGKSGVAWRISKATTARQVPDGLCVPLEKVIDVTRYMGPDGRLVWNVPPGSWTILRMGHTSTGHTNATGGGGKGLECDKFNPVAVRSQFEHWFGAFVRTAGPVLAARVIKVFHVDSWECGSQNWSPVFRAEFKKRRGYDVLPYLPVMAGIPLRSAAFSEKVLLDVRRTIDELINDNFFGTMAALAHRQGCQFSSESIAPVITSDGMSHYKAVDIPMGEFWLRSPTHDKPNDILDAVSGGHIYGKRIIGAEAFTELRLQWDESPSLLKALQDRNYALGINRLVYHVFMHNPWTGRRPGMTLDGVGTFLQRDQTWWQQGKAWVTYSARCQALLQMGRPVTDIAVFTGEDLPSRAILPDRLTGVLPGLLGDSLVRNNAIRMANTGVPLVKTTGVQHVAGIADPVDWVDALHGYAYDSFNRDALLSAAVRNGRITLPGGASYAVLVLPGVLLMQPDSGFQSAAVARKVLQLAEQGATVLVNGTALNPVGGVLPETMSNPARGAGSNPAGGAGPETTGADDLAIRQVCRQLTEATRHVEIAALGKGCIIRGPFHVVSFDGIGLQRDLIARTPGGKAAGSVEAEGIAYTHRRVGDRDMYFVSNQRNTSRRLEFSLRVAGKTPELWDAVTGEISPADGWKIVGGRTILPVRLDASGSVFIVFRKAAVREAIMGKVTAAGAGAATGQQPLRLQSLDAAWNVHFDTALGGPSSPVVFASLQDWSKDANPAIRHYSGTAVYTQTFEWKGTGNESPVEGTGTRRVWLDLGRVANLAGVSVNGVDCGVAWTAPYRVEITKALRQGKNQLRIEVTNTWANRLIGDHDLPEAQRVTWTTASYRLDGRLLEAGLLGPVTIRAREL